MERAAWVWEHLPEAGRQELWRGLAGWVEWLEQAYAPWVVLPPCWAAHEGLSTELAMLWCWHDRLRTRESDPADGVRWHAELRHAAGAWQAVAMCEHQLPGPEQQRIRAAQLARRDQFLAEAIAQARPGE